LEHILVRKDIDDHEGVFNFTLRLIDVNDHEGVFNFTLRLIDVNDHVGVFNFTLRLKSRKVTAIFIALRKVSIYQRGNQKP
jgi:hypothetical protein